MDQALKLIPTFVLLLIFCGPLTIYGFDAPNHIAPPNNATVTIPTLSWEKPTLVYSTNPYRIQVDDKSDFLSPEKDTYTANEYYTPSLTEGTWYWRIYYRDNVGVKSDWSTVSSFILQSVSPSPTSTPIDNPSSSPEVQPSASPSPSPNQFNFILSGIPSSLDVDQGFVLNINLNNLTSNSVYFLKGAFKKSDSTNYFGQTQVNGNWIKNSASSTQQFRIDTTSTSWTGQISVMPDSSDSGYSGSGQYLFKLARYDGNGTNLTWSDETPIQINGNPTASSPTIISTPSPTHTPSLNPSPSPLTSTSPIIFPTNQASDQPIASIAGVIQDLTSPSPAEITNNPPITNPFFNPTIWYILGGSTFVVSAGMFAHRAYKLKNL